MKHFFSTFLLTTMLIGSVIAQPFAIGSRTVTLNDPARNNRAIGCQIYYPAASAGNNAPLANGVFPVIVVGHGFSMNVGAYENWWSEFVPEGYIFVLPTTEVGPIPFPSHPNFGLDLAFAAAELQDWGSDPNSDFFGKVAPRTGLMGHSMGGGCSFLAAENNPLIDCVLGLAPAETNTSAIAAAANVTAPTMILWGTEDEVTPEASHALAIFNSSGATCKNYIRIDQGAHCFFADYNFFCATGEMNIGTLTREEQHQVSFSLAHPFFDYFLKDECDAYDDLQVEIATNPELGTNILSCSNTAPGIADNAGTLESDQQTNYQWYLNGNEIQGADQQTFVYSQAGTYQVGSINLGNCPVLSNEITVQITGIVEPNLNLTLRPIGVSVSSSETLKNVQLDWFDVSGRLFEQSTISVLPANETLFLPKPNYEGLKLLRLQSNEVIKTWRLF
jgi:pimeloyl-ACP methyl ester carboxylesterase